MSDIVRIREGVLSDFFTGIAVKRLSMVDAGKKKYDPNRKQRRQGSNQHEFGGAKILAPLFGEAGDPVQFPAVFFYLVDEEDGSLVAPGRLTWYDSRRNNPNRAPEPRLYYATDPDIVDRYQEGDTLIIAKRKDGSFYVFVAESSSLIGDQLRWLFGVSDADRFTYSTVRDTGLSYATRLVLDRIGIEARVETPEDEREAFLAGLDERFHLQFPTSRIFSAYARETLAGRDLGDGDGTIVAWMDRETLLFKLLEESIIRVRLDEGFETVDDFLSYSLSVQNRRKSRAGQALENHLEALFETRHILNSRTPTTERRNKPDFIFPTIEHYRDMRFDESLLTMLGAKTTVKERWRQVEDEADRIALKHLITLQPAITVEQTEQMGQQGVQLVVPLPIHSSYTDGQREWLMTVEDFLALVLERQERAAGGGHSRLF